MDRVIDFRIRPPLPSFRNHFIFASHTPQRLLADPRTLPVFHRDRQEARSAREFSLELMQHEMDDAGVTHAVIMGRDTGDDHGTSDNEEIARFCAASQGRFVGFAGVNPANPRGAIATIRRAKALGLRGLAFDNGFLGLHQDDPSLWPIYDIAMEENLPLALTASSSLGPDLSYAHPERFRTVAKRYPDLPIIISHAAWPWATLACAVAYECPNVYLLPDCYLVTHAPGTEDYINAANHFMADRLLYASAYPVRPLGQSLRRFKELALKPEAMEGALFRNAQRLLNWPKS